MSDIDIEKYINEERRFLHDISNHLVVIQGNASYLKRVFSKMNQEEFEKEVERTEKLNNAISRLVQEIKDRRSEIKGLQGLEE